MDVLGVLTPLQMASDCNNHSGGFVCVLHHLVYCEMSLLRPLLLLRVLLLPEVLWKLLRLLRYSEETQAEVPRRPLRSGRRSFRISIRTRHDSGSNTNIATEGCRSAAVCDFRRVQEGGRRGLVASDADLGRLGKQEVRGRGGLCRVAKSKEAREQRPEPTPYERNVASSHTWRHHSCWAERQKSLRTTRSPSRCQWLHGCWLGSKCIWNAGPTVQPDAQWV